MNCDEVRELLAAYAVDALTADERAAVREHLAGCALHPELAGLLATVEALGGSVPEAEPPAGLRARVLSGAVAARPVPLQRRRRVLPLALAAAIAALAIGVGWWAVRDTDGVTWEGTAVAGAARSRVTYAAATHRLVFSVEELAPAGPGKTYQLWVVRGATPVSLGTFDTTGGRGSVTVETDLASGETIAVTLEPAGGSPAPTTPPFLAVKF